MICDGARTNQSQPAWIAHVLRARLTQLMNLFSPAPDIKGRFCFCRRRSEGGPRLGSGNRGRSRRRWLERIGNGRIGRVLISRSLVKESLLDHPVVYMSAYINAHKQTYVDLLREISRRGGDAWSNWIGFILDAIRTQALDAIRRSENLITLREEFHHRLKESSAPARLFKVVDQLFSMPAINIAEIIKETGVTKPTAAADMERLEKAGILTEYTGRERDRDWLARDIIKVIEEETHPNE